MLQPQFQEMLKSAAESKNPERINTTIQMVRLLSPDNFFKVDANGKDIDPAMNKRVFFNMPYSSHWTGDFVTGRNENTYQAMKGKPNV